MCDVIRHAMSPLALFLDHDGVMNDNRVRALQWHRLVGEFFAPILGGSEAAWAEANRTIVEEIFEPGAWEARRRAAPNYAAFDRAYFLDWLTGMCRLVGVPAPPEDELLEL